MEFINRKKELKDFENYLALSAKKCFPVVLYGQRRIGKTRLVQEFGKKKEKLYFFVDDSKNSELLLKEFVSYLRDYGCLNEYEVIDSWTNFFKIIFSRLEGSIIIFDEFQNFSTIDKSVYSIIQNLIDQNEDKPYLFIFLGSIIGLMKTIFEDQREPLFGRMKAQFHLKAFKFEHILEFSEKLGYKDMKFIIELYSFFGGYPRYYTLLEDYNIKGGNIYSIIEKLVLEENALLKKEVINTLKLNFGKSKVNYYSILEAIGQGNTKITQIANYIGLSVNSTSFFLSELTNYYEFLKRRVPITEKDFNKSKNGIYEIENNFFYFYFRFIHKNSSLLEFGNNEKLVYSIRKGFVHMVAKVFEDICREFLPGVNSDYLYGKWWNRQGDEIDIVGINDNNMKILYGECKWQDNVDALKILEELSSKTDKVLWNNEKREEEYVVFARSFMKKVSTFNNNKVTCYDLSDIEKMMRG